jgi:formylglycine-generating enzyme required for sulfatase activity
MGSPQAEGSSAERPQLKVTIARSFSVARYAVTRSEFESFVKAAGYPVADSCFVWVGPRVQNTKGASFRSPGFTQDDRHPAVCINWTDAQAYVAWLTKITGRSYFLLSEAQREYVTRAGSTTAFWWGNSIVPAQANYNGNAVYKGGGSLGEYRQRTVAVDSFAANPWGLYNVHGNVWEWTMDCWTDTNSGNPGDGSARLTGKCDQRVIRGGSWNNEPYFLRSAFRYYYPARDRFNYQGFRVARDSGP